LNSPVNSEKPEVAITIPPAMRNASILIPKKLGHILQLKRDD